MQMETETASTFMLPCSCAEALHERVSWFAFEAAPQTKLRISACSSWHALSAPVCRFNVKARDTHAMDIVVSVVLAGA